MQTPVFLAAGGTNTGAGEVLKSQTSSLNKGEERQGTNRTGEVCCTDHCYTLLLCQFLSFLEQSSESKKPVRKLLAWRRRDNQFINAY